jgi:hypothetical protein
MAGPGALIRQLATFQQWLGERSPDELSRILATRPDAAGPPWPRHLRALAMRLADPAGTTASVRRLAAPAVQVLRAMAALPVGAGRGELARLLGVDAADRDLTRVMAQLAEAAYAWESPSGRLLAAPNVLEGWPHPLGLGSPAAFLLEGMPFPRVKEIARRLGLSLAGGKQAVTERLLGRYQDRAALAALVASGPKGVRKVLAPFVHEGPVHYLPGVSAYHPSGEPMTPQRWAAEHGLLFERDWSQAEMPREVALTLRGPDSHAPFTPAEPAVKAAPDDPAAVDQEAAAAAGHLLERAGALLDLAARTPVAVLKSGGVGRREVKRLGNELHCPVDEVRVLLEVLYAAGLLPESSAGHVCHPDAGQWSAAPDGTRMARLLAAWWGMDRSPLRRDDAGALAAVLCGPAEDGVVAEAVRQATFAVLAELPHGTGAADPAELAEAVAWRCPLYPNDLVAEFLDGTLAEARLLGLVVRDAASGLGRALVGGDLDAVATKALAVVRPEALFGTDLTAVVTGPPSAELARLLDRVADRETRGNASVWRFSPASVRRALDDGLTADQTLAALAKVSSGELPQPLTYLVTDVARRHGEVTVTDVVCVVRATDEALLAEIAGHRRLAKLGLHLLAPTVLASPRSASATLVALREAGYAPVPAGLDGVPTVERAAPAPPATTSDPAGPDQVVTVSLDLDRLARSLLGTSHREPVSGDQLRTVIARHCGRLPFSAQFALDSLVRYGHPTRVDATVDGGTRSWTLSHGEIYDDVLDAWCDDTMSYRQLELSCLTHVG